MKTNTLLVALVSLMVSVSSYAGSDPDWYVLSKPIPPNAEEAIKEQIAYSFKDPSSAQFRGTFFSVWKKKGNLANGAETHARAYCGQVNAKNSYGAYVGFRPFVVLSGTVAIGGNDNILSEIIIKNILDYCSNPI